MGRRDVGYHPGTLLRKRLLAKRYSRPMTAFEYQELLPLGHADDETPYTLLTRDGISTFEAAGRSR